MLHPSDGAHVICPHCSYENPDGRKYCRGCAKPLSTVAVSAEPPAVIIPAMSAPKPVTDRMAFASLVLSFFGFIPPIGIAAVVFGHISRTQIRNSEGRQKGMWLAFWGLVNSYLQFASIALLLVGLGSFWQKLNHELDSKPYVRAAVVDRLMHGNEITPEKAVGNRENALQALRLINARQGEYLAAHRQEGYACALYKLGCSLGDASECGARITNSRYEFQFQGCGPLGEQPRYALVAVPRSEFNPAGSPLYCTDHSGIIRRYSGANWIGAIRDHTCPETGENIR